MKDLLDFTLALVGKGLAVLMTRVNIVPACTTALLLQSQCWEERQCKSSITVGVTSRLASLYSSLDVLPDQSWRLSE